MTDPDYERHLKKKVKCEACGKHVALRLVALGYMEDGTEWVNACQKCRKEHGCAGWSLA